MSKESPVKGVIVSVNLSGEKGTSKTPVPEIHLNEKGITEDAHAGEWHRQVSLLASESIERFGAAKARTFSPGDFAENITTRGIDLSSLAPFDRLISNSVVLEVTQIGKKCHGGSCAIFQQVGECIMPREGIFCRVIRGGDVKAGDAITLQRRTLCCRVVTLSDRASGGIYPDRSGPRACELLKAFCEREGWEPRIAYDLLPDDAARLTETLAAARESAQGHHARCGGAPGGQTDPRNYGIHPPDLRRRQTERAAEPLRSRCIGAHPGIHLARQRESGRGIPVRNYKNTVPCPFYDKRPRYTWRQVGISGNHAPFP